MNKRKKIMIIVVGIQVLIFLGIYFYLKNPMFYYYEDDCACSDVCGSHIVFRLRLYNFGLYRNRSGYHFLSREEYKIVMNDFNKLKEKLKDVKPLDNDSIKCPNGGYDTRDHIIVDGAIYELPHHICNGSECKYSLYDEETGKLIDEIRSYLTDA